MDRAASAVVVCLVIWATAHSVKGEDSVTGHRNYCMLVVEGGVASIPYASCIQMRSRIKTQPRPNYYPCLTGLKLVSVRVLLDRRRTSKQTSSGIPTRRAVPSLKHADPRAASLTCKEVAMAVYDGEAFEVHRGRRSSSCK